MREGAGIDSIVKRVHISGTMTVMREDQSMDSRPIGVFDSGVGGLSIWRAIRRMLPQESLIFFADSGHVPYGEKSTAELHDLTGRIAGFLIEREVKMIVVACNTATVHAGDNCAAGSARGAGARQRGG